MTTKTNISLATLEQCTGCAACKSICPTHSIDLREDADGFRHPYIDATTCIGCHKCEKTCPIITPRVASNKETTKVYATQLRKKEDLLEVSSGGAFWALAKAVLDNEGVVYGARQIDVDRVQHVRADSIEGAQLLRRSKYLPSVIDGIYENVKEDLQKGLQVLFSGTGCQIAGLLGYLHKDYENLITIDVVCHGIPSMKVWMAYKREKEEREKRKLVEVVFRSKTKGWKQNHYKMTFDDGSIEYCPSVQHPFHKGYLRGLFSRRSCAACPFATLERVSDITLADYWQYDGSLFNPTNGVSLVCVHSAKGDSVLHVASKYMEYEPTALDKAIASCRHLTHTPLQHPNRDAFFASLDKCGYMIASTKCMEDKKSMITGFMKKITKGIKKIMHYSYVRTSQEDRAVIRQYYNDLGKRTVFAETFWESWRIMQCRNRVLVSSNGIVRKIAKIFRMRNIVEPRNITTTAQQYAAMKEALLLLHRKQVPVYFYHRVGREDNFTYSSSALHRIENDLSFPKMYEDIDAYMSEFKELMGADVTKDYVENVGKITQIIKKGNYLCHEDIAGACVNVIGGKRITAYQPTNYKRTLHVYGRCGAFGYAVEDKDTLPSRIQWQLNQSGHGDIRVINHGLWGGEDKNIHHDFLLDMLGMKDGDMVLFYMHHLDPMLMQQLEQRGMWYKDLTHEWHQYPEASWCFYNYPGHMSAVGYKNVAELICKDLADHEFKCCPLDNDYEGQKSAAEHINYYLKMHAHNDAFDKEIDQYVKRINDEFPLSAGMQCGAIVMNCNPFTYGHRYLIEKAAAEVDRLYIFVVEEDKSFFKFNDRFEMVKSGTADLKNVCVVPSGNFIISAFTFPEYFMKDYVKEKEFDMSSDVEIFGSKIAPALQISKRFAGEEPFDVVTKHYNETMNELLPQYGVQFIEIPRAETSNGKVINATLVRNMLASNEFDEMREFVPDSTLKVLRERYSNHG